MQKVSTPLAVLCSDIHYNINTLTIADQALRQAVEAANALQVPLVIAGDLHDTKANLRGECIKAIIDTIKMCHKHPYIIVGNHCKINHASTEHSLEFLRPYAEIVDKPTKAALIGSLLLPYYHDKEELRAFLAEVPPGSRIIMHQGIEGSQSGEYIQDHSAITSEDVKDFRVISGHYHTRQDIKTGRPRKGAIGLWSYVGNPYTLTFAEANDPPKGFQVLYSDGTLEFVATNLRRHIKIRLDTDLGNTIKSTVIGPNDLVWAQIEGPKEDLKLYTKEFVAKLLHIPGEFRLETIPTDSTREIQQAKLSQPELLDKIIDSSTSKDIAERLKKIWRGM